MKTPTLSLLIVGVAACLAEAGGFKWNSGPGFGKWVLPSETPVADRNPTVEPKPTDPPELRRARRIRDDTSSTDQDAEGCGYVYGLQNDPFTCGSPSMSCFMNTEHHAFGCCSGPDCSSTANIPVQTTCLDSTEAQSITTSIDDYTGLCTETQNQYCMTLEYQDMSGYSIFGCTNRPSMTMPILYDIGTTMVRSSMTAASAASSSTGKNDDDGGSGTNYGAIIGGVVAGVALGVFLILIAVCCRRPKPRHRSTKNQPMSTVGGYQRAPQTPAQDSDTPFQIQLPHFETTDASTGIKTPYSMSSYGAYDSSLRDFPGFHENLSPRSQSPVSPGSISIYSRRRPGSPLSESMNAYSMAEVAAKQPFLQSPPPGRSIPVGRPGSRPGSRPTSSGMLSSRPTSSGMPSSRPTSSGMPSSRPTSSGMAVSRPASSGGRLSPRPVSSGMPVSRPSSAGRLSPRPTSRPPSRPTSRGMPPAGPNSRPPSGPASRPASRPNSMRNMGELKSLV